MTVARLRFCLAALAANRFGGARERPGAARAGWRPLALRWRRQMRQAKAAIVAVRRAPAAIWSPHLHFHVAAGMPAAVRSRQSTVFVTSGTTPERPRCLVERRTEIRFVRFRGAPIVGRAGYAVAGDGPAAVERRPAAAAPALVHPARAASPARLRWLPTPAGGRLRTHAPAIARAFAPDTPPTAPPRPGPAIREPRLFFARPLPPDRGAPSRARDGEGPPPRRGRASEMVWRRLPQPPPGVEEASPRAGARAPAPASPMLASPGPTAAAAPEAPRGGARAEIIRAADIDPGVLDRLADDVVRRVERRVRIERERRGL